MGEGDKVNVKEPHILFGIFALFNPSFESCIAGMNTQLKTEY